MENSTDSFRSSHVTLIFHSDCESCDELLEELEPIRKESAVVFETVNLLHEQPPAYAQAYIIPATYVNGKLWRYGKYSLQTLEDCLRRRRNGTSDEAAQ
jgi:thiol-disulfide isomerase/thioredoxin